MNKNDRNWGKCHLGTDSSPVMTNLEHCRTARLQTKQNQDLSSLCRYKNLNFSKKWAGNLSSYHHYISAVMPCLQDRQLQLNSEPGKSRNLSSKPDLQTIYQVFCCLLKKKHKTSLLVSSFQSLLTLPCEPSTSLRAMTCNYTWFSCCLYWGLDWKRAYATLASSFFCYGLGCSNCEKEINPH